MTFHLHRQGALFVLSSPSGGGKSTILHAVLRNLEGAAYSVSATTRQPRPGETDGKDYFFLSEEEFARRREDGHFLESAEVHGHWYGTPRAVVEEALARGQDVAMDIDVQGGLEVKRLMPGAVLIFILPPSMAVLEERLRARRSDTPECVALRLANARKEVEFWPRYDYVVVNEALEGAVAEVEHIIRAERRRTMRQRLD